MMYIVPSLCQLISHFELDSEDIHLSKTNILNSYNIQGGPSNTSLYYRKAGHGPDGWVVGPDLDNYIITTRDDKAYCPDNVREGFDQDRDKDDGFGMICEVVSDDLDQDPGIPAAPLEILKPNKAISSSAKETLRSSACFRYLDKQRGLKGPVLF